MARSWSAALLVLLLGVAAGRAASQTPLDPGPENNARERRMQQMQKAKAERRAARSGAERLAPTLGVKPDASDASSEKSNSIYSQAYKTRNFRMTRMLLQKVFEANPTDPDAHARLGLSLARAGHYQEAQESLTLGQAGDIFGDECLGGFADALRYNGALDQAIDLRKQRILAAAGESGETAAWESLSEDYRWAGDFEASEEAAWMALSIQPGSPQALLSLASHYMDAGDLDEAEFYLWLSNRYGDAGLIERVERARYLMLRGYLEEAAAVLDAVKGRFRLQANVATLRAEIFRREGTPEDGEAMIDGRRMAGAEFPYYLAERAALAVALGELDEAQSWLDLGLALYPVEPDVQRAAGLLEQARRLAKRD